MDKIFYCAAVDRLNLDDVRKEYKLIKKILNENGFTLTNEHDKISNLPLSRENANVIVAQNLECLKKADIVLINLSLQNHMYVGTIGEMIYAKQYNKKIIIIEGKNEVNKHFWALYHSDYIVKTLDDAISLALQNFEGESE